MRIYHLLGRADWDALGERYAPPSLASEGFVHFSRRDQLLDSANRFFAGRDDVVVLAVDEARLPEVRVEDGFPHVYGAIPAAAIRGAWPLPRDEQGAFSALPDLDGAPPLRR